LEALKHMQKSGNYKQAESIYEHMGFVCRNTGQFKKAAEYLEMAVAIYKKEHRTLSVWHARENIADAYRKMHNNLEALTIVQQTAKEFPPSNTDENMVMLRCLGNCYKALKRYALAEKFLPEMIETGNKSADFDASGYRDIGQFYIEQGQFEKGGMYLRKMISHIDVFSSNAQAHIYYMLYKADSAAGDYLSALNNLVKNKRLDDAIWEESKSRHIREIQIQYETEKKDQELKLKEQDFLLLSHKTRIQQEAFEKSRLALQFESEVKEKSLKLIKSEAAQKDKDLELHQRNISLLQKDALIRQSSLSEANLMKNVTIAGILLTTVILILLYNQYRVKKRNSREVEVKNQMLESLLSEKELLLKEVHHRVKNNLQTIISLLETQSRFLKDDALMAIRNSQHRIYAMSLIHQKLYYLDNSTSIDMAVYLPELLNYLKESFDVGNSIRFRTNIEHIRLEISQAIPAGLILNEVITNSIKYAFSGKSGAEIVIEMIMIEDKKIRFSVADNGSGLPENWHKTKHTSLGLNLMKGLSDDIHADFTIESGRGTKIMVEFEIHRLPVEAIDNSKDQPNLSARGPYIQAI
ncbi:MAG: hypothetical protein H7122_02315, partial [Chitinophagaceae bacterium]|nr:hypothetical protein [Chitinophagaceae bacterium]